MRTTVTLDDDLAAYVDDQDASSDAEAVRQCIRRCRELEERVDELEQKLQQERQEKQQLLDRRDRLESIEARMATSDEIEEFKSGRIRRWIRDKLL